MMNSKAVRTPSKFVIARNLKALREQRRWSQKELARKTGVSQSTISNMETPDRAKPRYSPTTDNVDAVAAVFGLNAAVLSMQLPLDLLLDFGKMGHVISNYADSDPEGRQAIEAVSNISKPRYLPAPADSNKQP